MKSLLSIFPIFQWLPDYKRAFVKGDFYAGLTVGVLLIPQGMAYAMIVGVPPVYGLYASMIPPLVYAVFGTSRQLSVGPAAMDSLMVAAGVSALAVSGTEVYLQLAIMVAFFMGAIQILLGVFRMGFIANLLSKPVISGFTSAAAVIIAVNQLKHLLGIDLIKGGSVIRIVTEVWEYFSMVNPLTVSISVGSIALIYLVKRLAPKLPGSLVAVVLSTLMVFTFHLEEYGVKIVKTIPEGLPGFSVPSLNMESFISLLPLSITLAFVAFMEAYSVAKSMESKRKDHKVKANKELIALGASNFIGSFFQSFPVTGGFGRTAVNFQTGALTAVASVISSMVVGLTLLFFTPLFYYLPTGVLAAVIMVAVVTLFDVPYSKQLWHDSKAEFALLAITFLVTLGFNMVPGILTGIALSVLLLMFRAANPHIAQLGRVKGHHEFRNIRRFKDLEQWDNLLILRIDAPMSFINIKNIKDYIENAIVASPKVEKIILDAGPISHLDATAAQGLRELHEFLKAKSIALLICDLIGPVRDLMYHTGLIELIGEENVFLDLNGAIAAVISGANDPARQFALQHNE